MLWNFLFVIASYYIKKTYHAERQDLLRWNEILFLQQLAAVRETHTNYISNKQYRNVIAGKQRLNGNQVLGYVRVRMVPTSQGENGDLGRTARLRSVLSSVIEENNKKELSELTEVITNIIPSISSDLSLSQMVIYMNTVLQSDLDTATISIPVDDSYTSKVQDGMSVMKVDLDKNRKILKQILN